MTLDQSSPLPPAPGPDWRIPEVVDVRIRRAEFRPRQPRNFDSPLPASKGAVEIIVTLKSPLPIRAVGPVLYVGGAQLTESEAMDKEGLKIRFWALEPGVLNEGAPVALGWMGHREEQQKTKFTFRLAR